MNLKSRQFQSEEQKTISIIEARKLRLKILKSNKGLIEIVNSKDNGRVCTLRVDDFRSVDDALVYAELLKLAPQLLDNYLSDAKTLEEVVGRLNKKISRAKEKGKASHRKKGK